MHLQDGSKGTIDLPRTFLLIGGAGAGIGNFIVFYPAAYYFAALTGREILILDDSLIGTFKSYQTRKNKDAAFDCIVPAAVMIQWLRKFML